MKASIESPEQRQVTQIRTRALLFLIVAVIAGAAAVLLVKQYLDRMAMDAAASAPKTRSVVVASMDIPIAMRLEEKHLTLVKWPENYVPEGSFGNIAAVIDKTVRQNIVKGEVVLRERLADETSGQGLAALLADGMRAMAVEVDAVVGVAGFVQPGDYVDVITTMQPDEETNKARKDMAAKVSKIILQYVRVLAVGEHLTTTTGGKPVNVKVVTLGVTPAESEKLALASQYGKLQLSLRSRIDQQMATTDGITPSRLLSGGEPAATLDPAKTAEDRPRQPFRYPKPTKPAEVLDLPRAPDAPVVEILRGTKVEERKLHSSSVQP
jgi:pilus assembly protein CpaB